MKNFSKSRLVSLRQCPRRFWLELYRPELKTDSPQTQQIFKTGHLVGDIARRLFDPEGVGALVDLNQLGFAQALLTSEHLLRGDRPIFEAGLSGGGVLAFADIMLPAERPGSWHMVEVKSSTSVKDYHQDDIAIQTFAARATGVHLESVSLAHIDSSWTYPGEQDYRGLLKRQDLTRQALARQDEVAQWVQQAQAVAQCTREPDIAIGAQCSSPFACSFIAHCSEGVQTAEYPLQWLPRISAKVREELEAVGITDLRHAPDSKLTETQQRVKQASVTGQPYFDAHGAAKDLARYPLPCQFLDFEAVQFGVPIWAGTRPFQQICFQFSLHTLHTDGHLDHQEYLDLSGADPSAAFAQALIAACGAEPRTIFVYNAGFEKTRIGELAERFPDLTAPLQALKDRIVDLMPIVKNRYYHPRQEGSWSIKNVLPVLVPELKYSDLDGVQDGTLAILAYQEAIAPYTTAARKQEIERQLRQYCQLDTYSMVKIWQAFAR